MRERLSLGRVGKLIEAMKLPPEAELPGHKAMMARAFDLTLRGVARIDPARMLLDAAAYCVEREFFRLAPTERLALRMERRIRGGWPWASPKPQRMIVGRRQGKSELLRRYNGTEYTQTLSDEDIWKHLEDLERSRRVCNPRPAEERLLMDARLYGMRMFDEMAFAKPEIRVPAEESM